MATILKVLLKQNHLQTYDLFRIDYQKAARKIGSQSLAPSKAQFHRWLAGDLKKIPHARHCQVLKAMFPDWSAETLFSESTGDEAPTNITAKLNVSPSSNSDSRMHLSGVSGVYTSRSDFSSHVSVTELFDAAKTIEISGLSLNLICQQYSTNRLLTLMESGATVECLFLDPDGQAIQDREREEGYENRRLQTLTAMNIEILNKQVHEKLDAEASGRLRIATYDQTLRFNMTFVDQSLCFFQPYAYAERGAEAPTFMAEKSDEYGVFDSMYKSYLWLKERSTDA